MQVPTKLPKNVLVDERDYELVNSYKSWWISKRGDVYTNTYPYGNGKAKSIKLHRLIMGVTDPKQEVDHMNHNRLDNRRSNLRICTHAQNGKNLPLKKNNTSGVAGVFWDKSRGKWTARIKVMYRDIHLGRFSDIEQAISMRLFAEQHYYGEFAPER